MTNTTERQILEVQLAAVDRRRALLEAVLVGGKLSGPPESFSKHRRQQLESELRDLWSLRLKIARQLTGH